MSWEPWKRAIAAQLIKIACGLERNNPTDKIKKTAKSLRDRAAALMCCGALVMYRQCEACGEGRPGSGVVTSAGKPCDLRVCSWCAARRSREMVAELEALLADIEDVKGYRWRFITLQMAYDSADPWAVSVEGLRTRAETMKRIIRFVWEPERVLQEQGNKRERGAPKRRGLKQVGVGMLAKIELSGRGFVHGHVLYYGPFVEKSWFEKLMKEGDPSAGHCWIEDVEKNERGKRNEKVKSLKGAILEVAKYCVKLPSGKNEAWVGGENRWVMSPELVANWEAATIGLRLVERYGVLRGKNVEKEVEEHAASEESVHEKDCDKVCVRCGVVGEWRNAMKRTGEWVRECHVKGLSAFAGSRWKPKERLDLNTSIF